MIHNISDINLWEQGTTSSEQQNKTWEQIKGNSDTRIRTKNLFPCSSSLKVKISSNYNIDLLWFNEEGLMISEIETNWMQGNNNEFISISVPNNAKQAGILVRFTNNSAISPSEILNTNIYYDDGLLSNNSIIAENIINIMIGEIQAQKMYFGNDLIWEYNSLPNYFRFKALESGTFTLTIPTYVYSSKIESVSYSVDNGETWITTQNANENIVITTPTIQQGDEVLWKGSGKSLAGNGNSSSFSYFSSTGNFEISGNIMSILYEDDFEERVSLEQSYNFCKLFYNCTKLVDASKLELPATTLTNDCYNSMFYGCTNLLNAPELPALTLTNNCYISMFNNCQKLTQAPELNASTLVTNCYREMFNSCKVLDFIKCLAEDISASNCTTNWVKSVSSTGEFIGISTTPWERGVNGIPTNWTLTDDSSQ